MKKSYIVLFFFCFFSISVIYFMLDYRKKRNNWKNKDYFGIIEGINPNPYFAGFPQLKLLNGDLIQLGIREESIFPFIQIGDSIVKNSGSTIVSVFRKDENGNWVEKEFDCK
jgi:hypothetical protein